MVDLALRVHLASIAVHVEEHEETGDPSDLEAARALVRTPTVQREIKDLRKQGLMPLKRSG